MYAIEYIIFIFENVIRNVTNVCNSKVCNSNVCNSNVSNRKVCNSNVCNSNVCNSNAQFQTSLKHSYKKHHAFKKNRKRHINA